MVDPQPRRRDDGEDPRDDGEPVAVDRAAGEHRGEEAEDDEREEDGTPIEGRNLPKIARYRGAEVPTDRRESADVERGEVERPWRSSARSPTDR